MEPQACEISLPIVLPPAPAAPACPRCRTDLSAVRHPGRRGETLLALLCPSVTCGFKRIVPT